MKHYLIRMIHQILTDTDSRSTGEVNAVIATLYDWKEAFPRQCPKIGIEAFIRCGVRPSLIPVLISYLQGRTMKVKWHGVLSSERKLNGGVAQGSTFGIWQYLAGSNDNANCVPEKYRYKFVDDLSVLEKINLLIVGLASHNLKLSVPNDILVENQIIDPVHLKSQQYLNEIAKWTADHKGILNEKKTKVMIFNYSRDHQFTTRLQLNNHNIEIINETRLLGVQVTDDLKWNRNTEILVKKANQRMQILRKASEFTSKISDRRQIYILYVRSILEQSCVVWNSSLTQENIQDLERVQKAAVRVMLGQKYTNYEDGLEQLNLKKLSERRNELCLRFAKKCLENEKTQLYFPLKVRKHQMKTRKPHKYSQNKVKTNRLQSSAIPMMQKQLNQDYLEKRNGKI